MLKLLVMLGAFLVVAQVLLGLRQHRLELTSQSVSIYSKIRDCNDTLQGQQADIAVKTNQWTLAAALEKSGIDTGKALRPPVGKPGANGPSTPQVETDLLAPLMEDRTNSTNAAR